MGANDAYARVFDRRKICQRLLSWWVVWCKAWLFVAIGSRFVWGCVLAFDGFYCVIQFSQETLLLIKLIIIALLTPSHALMTLRESKDDLLDGCVEYYAAGHLREVRGRSRRSVPNYSIFISSFYFLYFFFPI